MGVDVRKLQEEDETVAPIMNYLKKGELPEGLTRGDEDKIRKMAEACFIEDGKLWYTTSNKVRDKTLLFFKALHVIKNSTRYVIYVTVICNAVF